MSTKPNAKPPNLARAPDPAALEIRTPGPAALEIRTPTDPSRDPLAVYLARLPRSARVLRSSLDQVAKLLGFHNADYVPWGRLAYAHVAAIAARLGTEPCTTGEPRAPATAGSVLAAVKGVLREAWRLQLITGEEFQRIKDVQGPKGSRVPGGRALAKDELDALFAAAGEGLPATTASRNRALLALMYGAGLRRDEAVSVGLDRWDDRAGTVRPLGKGRKERVVPLPPWAQAHVRAWLRVRADAFPPGGIVLAGDRPILLKVYQSGQIQHPATGGFSGAAAAKIVARIVRRAKLAPVHPHDLRRTYIGDLLDAGADLSAVQKLAGHSSPATTAGYDRRGQRAAKAAADRLPEPGKG